MSNVIKFDPPAKPVPLMECGNCGGDEFALAEDGRVACWQCGSMVEVKAEYPVRSNSPESVSGPDNVA
jgi:DNA-directed RNA polymerase subunit RPC12/RpoP